MNIQISIDNIGTIITLASLVVSIVTYAYIAMHKLNKIDKNVEGINHRLEKLKDDIKDSRNQNTVVGVIMNPNDLSYVSQGNKNLGMESSTLPASPSAPPATAPATTATT